MWGKRTVTAARRTAQSLCALAMLLGGTACDTNISSPFGADIGLGPATCETIEGAGQHVQAILRLVNDARVARGSFPLTLDDDLTRFADEWACTMIEEGFFDHDHPDGESFTERWDAAGLGGCYFGGENLAVLYESPEEVFDAWFKSEGHRSEILFDAFTHMGLAVRSDGENLVWVQEFRGGGCESGQTDPALITEDLAPRPPLPNMRSAVPAPDPAPVPTPQSADR